VPKKELDQAIICLTARKMRSIIVRLGCYGVRVMNSTNLTISRMQLIMGSLAVIAILLISGCGGFFAEKPIEIQTEEILDEIRQIKENLNVENPLPEIYRGKAKRIQVKDSVKLFYFSKNLTVDKLSGLITEQLGYKVDSSSQTNQLIIDCPNDMQADKTLEFLSMVDVPPIQVNIDCIILERFADVTMDWETTFLIENLLGERITVGQSKYPVPVFPGASLRESKRSTFGLDVGYWRNQGVTGHQLRVVIDMLVSRGYLKILMNPTIETINGQKAKILSRDNVPIERIVTERDVLPYSITEYQWVEDSLEVTPHVFADGSIGLATMVKLGSSSKPKGVVQVSIITERSIDVAENRIKPGDSLIIGGIRKTEERAIIRGTPLLKDIPIIGTLFSSKDFEESAKELIFILTPSISSGGLEQAAMMKKLRKKRAKPKSTPALNNSSTNNPDDNTDTKDFKQKNRTRLNQPMATKAKTNTEKSTIKKELKQMLERLNKK